MDEQNWQKLMKRMDLADKIDDVLICGEEDYDEAEAQIAALQKQLKQVEQDRMIREEGARPADEWKRKDFKYLLWYHKELQKLSTGEIRALFLIPAGIVNGTMYFKRGNVRELRRRRANGDEPSHYLAYPPMRAVDAQIDLSDACALREEDKKLDALWQKL